MAEPFIYLDHAASSPLRPEALDAMLPWFAEQHANPTASHRMGRRARQALDDARAVIAEATGFERGEIIFTGGGTEFVRAISRRVYGIEQERVVGTLVTYVVIHTDDKPALVRTSRPQGQVNEGEAKIANTQLALGRRPVLAAGNSPGDSEMLEYANSKGGPSLALLINHDDAEREYAYDSEAGTFDANEPIEATATRLGWTQVSMRDDWVTIFPNP